MVCAILKQYWWLFAFWKITPLIVGSSAFAVVGRESDAVLVSNINPSQVHCITFYSDIAGNKDYFIAPVEKIAYSALQVLRPVVALVFFLLLVILEKFYYFALLWCFVKKKYWILKINVIIKIYSVMTLVFLCGVGHLTVKNLLNIL